MSPSPRSQIAGRVSLISFVTSAFFTLLLTISSSQNWSSVGAAAGIGMIASLVVFGVSGFVKLAHIFVENFFNRTP